MPVDWDCFVLTWGRAQGSGHAWVTLCCCLRGSRRWHAVHAARRPACSMVLFGAHKVFGN